METAINKSLRDFYISYADRLYEDAVIRKLLLSYAFVLRDGTLSDREFFNKVLNSHLEEATLTLTLLSDLCYTKNDSLLEIGSGTGFVYGYLKKQGYNIYGIEPNDSGFDEYFAAAQHLFQVIGVDGSHCYPYFAKECKKINKQFDIIFSNNVLEHVSELEESVLGLKQVLKPGGIMLHNTVNYHIPYEPHFKILLFPFFPRLTELFKPTLKTKSLWNGLNFITTTKIRRVCNASGLLVEFKKDTLSKALKRLEYDQSFAKRQKIFVPIYLFLKHTGLIKLLNRIPSSLTTPIVFTLRDTQLKQ